MRHPISFADRLAVLRGAPTSGAQEEELTAWVESPSWVVHLGLLVFIFTGIPPMIVAVVAWAAGVSPVACALIGALGLAGSIVGTVRHRDASRAMCRQAAAGASAPAAEQRGRAARGALIAALLALAAFVAARAV